MRRFAERTGLVAALIIIITGTVSFVLGIYDYRKSVLDTAEAEFFFEYTSEFKAVTDRIPDEDEDFLEACVGVGFCREECVRGAWLYNAETGRVSSAEGNAYAEKHPEYFTSLRPDDEILNDIRLERTVKYRLADGAQYSYRSCGRYRIIVLHEAGDYAREISETVSDALFVYAATGLLVFVVISMLGRISGKTLRRGLVMAVLFLWVTGISAGMFLSSYRFYAENKARFNSVILGYIDEDIDGIMELSDDEAAEACQEFFPEEYSDGLDPHMVLARFFSSVYADGEYITSITAGENILDTGAPAEDRVDIAWAGNGNELAECIIQAMTIGILALVLSFEWTDSREKNAVENISDAGIRAYKGVVTLQGLTSGLVNAVMVVVLAESANAGGMALARAVMIVTAADFISRPLKHHISANIMRRFSSFRAVLLLNAALLLAGLLLCGLSSGPAPYIAGFVLIKACSGYEESSFGSLFREIQSGTEKITVESFDVANGFCGGSIAGMIITGIIAGLVSYRTLYLLAALSALASLLLGTKCTIASTAPGIPKTDYRNLLSKRDVRLFLLLIILMAGILQYCRDYAVPIAVDGLKYSAGTISFVYLLYEISDYVFAYLWTRTEIRNMNISDRNKAILYVLIQAAALILLVFRPTIAAISLMMVLFGACDALFYDYLLIEGEKTDSTSELRMVSDSGVALGRVAASSAVGAGLPVAVIPGILAVSPALYWLYSRKRRDL